jgi:hypothetical protein
MKVFIKYSILIILTLLLCTETYSQSITWRKFYSTLGNPIQSSISDIIETEDGGYIFTGTQGSGANNYLYAYGINSYGDSLWYKEYPYAGAAVIKKLNDGNYILMDVYCSLIKITPNGDTLWTKFRSFSTHLLYGNFFSYYNNEFFISGWNGYTNKPYLLRLDSLGNDIFLREFNYDYGYLRGLLVSGKDVYLSGYELLPENYFLIKTDQMGNIIWVKDYHEKQLNFGGSSIIKTPNEESIILGGSSNVNNNTAASLMKRDTAGSFIWQQNYDPGGNFFAFISFLLNDKSGGVISFGNAGPDNVTWFGHTARLIKFDYDGNELWRKQYGFNDEHYQGWCFKQTSDSGYIIGGLTWGVYQNTPIHIIKTNKFGNVVSINNSSGILPTSIKLYQNYPNPFNPSTTIKFELSKAIRINISVYDVGGKLIKTLTDEKYDAGTHTISFHAKNDLTSGIYFYSLKSEELIITKKLIFLK